MPPRGADGVRVAVIAGLALASMAIVGFLAFAPAPDQAPTDTSSGAPMIAAPQTPFKTPYTGPQTAPEPPAPREIYAAIGGKAASPAEPAGPPADPPKAEPPKADPPKAEPAKAEPAKPQPPKAQPVEAPTRPQTPAASRFSANGPVLAQLGAFSTQAAARDAGTALQAKAGALLADAALDVRRGQVDDGVIVYRLRVGAFADRAAAERFCQEMRAMGQGCMAVSR
jgi:outer membrane biosynthesis protein TonB